MHAAFAAFDFETANAGRASACAIGIVVVRGARIERHEWLIRPEPNEFHAFNTRLHGIDAAKVASEPTFGELWPRIEPLLVGHPIVAHNAPFDLSVLRACLGQYGLPAPRIDCYCSCRLARRTMPHLANHRLDTVAREVGFGFKHHDALEDAAAAAFAVLEMMKRTGTRSLPELSAAAGAPPSAWA